MTATPARLLVVGGSDSGGGAGIEADIKTACALGVYAMTAITAVTVQDTRGVHAIHPIPPRTVAAQIDCVLADIGADAIKIGMLGPAAMVAAVAAVLQRHARGIPVVLDPVMAAKGGCKLLAPDAVATLKTKLLPLATLVTPNLAEAAHLAGLSAAVGRNAVRAGQRLRALGANAVLVKGGHARKPLVDDVLVWEHGVETFVYPRIRTRHTHGTGCTLAAAIACHFAQGRALVDAVGRAREFLQKAIEAAPCLGRGRGPLNHVQVPSFDLS